MSGDQCDDPPTGNDDTSHASVPLRPDEQRAILGFAERSAELSDERTLELAQLLEPLTGERTDGPAELFRIANGLAGRE